MNNEQIKETLSVHRSYIRIVAVVMFFAIIGLYTRSESATDPIFICCLVLISLCAIAIAVWSKKSRDLINRMK